jgi:hypothetical protein
MTDYSLGFLQTSKLNQSHAETKSDSILVSYGAVLSSSIVTRSCLMSKLDLFSHHSHHYHLAMKNHFCALLVA